MTGARVSAGRPRGVDTAGAVWTVAVFTAVLVVVGHWLFLRVALIGDEPIHLSQVLRFVRGEGGMHPWLTTFPTFHWLASWIVRALGSESTSTVRLASTMLGILVVPAAWFVARARFDRAVSRARAFGVAFLPILVPYFFFIYTDAAALAALLAAVAAAERRRWLLAGAFGLLAVALRQTAIVWVAWLFAQYLWNERPWLAWRADGVRRLREASLFVATGIAFVAFVVLKQARPAGEDAVKIANELRNWVGKEIGPIAKPKDLRFGDNLPKTRSGKIMRRLLRAIAKGEAITQDVSTLENPAILDQLKQTN